MLGNKPGQRIIELVETDSTNSYAARLIYEQFPEDGTVIVAGFQKAGRGQRGNSWESEKAKNLLISYILYPSFLEASDQFLLNQVISLSLRETIQNFTSAKIAIKWPNDILAGHGKMAGILIENSIRATKIAHSIIGIGMNVNQLDFGHYTPPATSLAIIESRTFDLKEVLKVLNDKIDKWYHLLRTGNHVKIKNAYQDALYLFGVDAKFESDGNIFSGKISSIKDDGRLEIITDDHRQLLFSNKQVKFLYD